MKRLSVLMFCILLCTELVFSASVVLVKGTSSNSATETKYAASLTKRLERWMRSEGIPVIVTDDDNISRYAAKTKVMVLGYNANPGNRELQVLRSFVHKGGRLIVFYGNSKELASLMGMRIDKYKAAPLHDKWNEIRFVVSNSDLQVPSIIFQNSHNIRTVIPAGRNAKVIAYWADINGRLTGDPAVVQSSHGFWVTHVLLDDSDVSAKKKMLLGMIAFCDKSIWRSAALYNYKKVNGKIVGISRDVNKAGWQKDFNYLKNLMNAGKYPAAVEQSENVLQMAMYSYAQAQKPVSGELHGVWDHSGIGGYPGNWRKSCEILKKNGITDLFLNVSWAGMSHYYSRVTARSEVTQKWGDQLQAAVVAAHKAGIRVHAWKICWNLSKATPEFISEMKRQRRLQVSDTGIVKNWLCPSNKKNIALELSAISEMVKNYNVDGIHLDYIRYPDSHYCYCPVCRKNFEQYLGKKIKNWSYDVKKGKYAATYAKWRKTQIDDFVEKAYKIVKRNNRNAKLSVAVYGKYPLCASSVGQDWGRWLQRGIIDFVCPMNYTSDISKFRGLVNSQMKLPRAKGHIYPGIGVTAAECHLDGFDVIRQIRAVRNSGASGFILFSLNRELEKETLPILRRGILRNNEARNTR